MQATSAKWQVATRNAIVESMVSELTPGTGDNSGSPRSLGVLLTGAAGIGKSHLAAQAVKALQSEVHFVHLYARTFMSAEPYEALTALLSDLEPGSRSNHVQVLAATLRRLKSLSGGRDICILIDNAHELDEKSAVILAQLAKSRSVRLLLTCGTSDLLPHELSNLVKDGFVRRTHVEPFSYQEMVEAVEGRLGGRLSQVAARKLWAASGGHPQALTILTQDMQSTRALVLREGAWCLDESLFHQERISSELFSNQLRRLSQKELRILEIVALAGTISINTLLNVADDHDLDALEEKGIVRLDADRHMRIDSPLLAKVVRGKVPAGRSKSHWDTVSLSAPMEHDFTFADMGMVLWAAESGRKLERLRALDAARSANEQSKPALALRLLATVETHAADAVVAAEAARAHLTMGNQVAARSLLNTFYSSYHEEPTLTEWVVLLLGETSLLVTSKLTFAEALTNLEKVRCELYPDSLNRGTQADSANLGRLRELLALDTANAAWWTGNFPDGLDGLDRCAGDRTPDENNSSLLLDSHRCLMNAAMGNVAAASEIGNRLFELLDQAASPVGPLSKVRENLFFASLVMGKLDMAEDVARCLNSQMTAHNDCVSSIFADLALPLVMAVRGRGGECLSLLEQEINQLRLRDEYGALGLALSTGAYACILSGDIDSAALYLAELDDYKVDAPWLIERLATYFELTARGRSGESQTSIAKLSTMADLDASSGRGSWVVESLGLALRLGATDVAPRLVEAAANWDVAAPTYYLAFAQGIESGEAEFLIRAAELAAQQGNDSAAADAAETALSWSTLGQHESRRVRLLMEQCRRNMEVGAKRIGQSQPLTARQMEIAAAAADGARNKDIAASLHVSIRTVEGHLYQIFGKLGIAERSDLAFALKQAVGNKL